MFLRIVGKRRRMQHVAVGEPPPPAVREALASLVAYRTRAPKGVFIYSSHAEMDADRLRWTVEAMVERARHG